MRRFLGAALAVAVLALAAGGPAAARPPTAAGPDVYAHRGGAGIAPENTLGAFRQAHRLFGRQGVWLELDTQLTADGMPVVIHDHTLDRTTDCIGEVIHKTAAEVTACDASLAFPGWRHREPVPTLEQTLTEGKRRGWRLSVELKNIPGESNFDPTGTTLADAVVEVVARVGFPAERIVVQSFWPPSLDRIEQRAPALATALLTTSQLPGAPPGVGFNLTENAAFATARGYEISSPDHRSPDLSTTTVSLAQALGRQVVVWTVNDPAGMTRAAAWGVDGIISDRPDLAYAVLGR